MISRSYLEINPHTKSLELLKKLPQYEKKPLNNPSTQITPQGIVDSISSVNICKKEEQVFKTFNTEEKALDDPKTTKDPQIEETALSNPGIEATRAALSNSLTN